MISPLLIQIIGLAALLVAVLIFQVNNRKHMLILGVTASLLWTTHFLLLGALTASIMNFLGATRCYVYYKVKPSKDNLWIMWLFIVILAIAMIVTWAGPISLLPFAGSLFGVIAFWQKETKYIRRLALGSSPPWLIHNIIVGSYPGIIVEILLIVSNLIGQYRFDFKKTSSDN